MGKEIEFKTNTIHNLDILELLPTIPAESIDLVVTDPPYKMTSRGCNGTTGGMLKHKLGMSGNVFKHNNIKPQQYIPQFYRVLKQGSHCYIMTNHINLVEMLNIAIESGFHFIKSLIWEKDNKIMGQYYMSQFEYILFFRKGFGKKINNCGTSDILSIANKKSKDENGNNFHDTEKPIELMKILIENSSDENDIVLEPFMGVGSTCIASKKLKRQYIGCEIDKTYFDIAQHRINETTPNLITTLF
jgi:site-specific DNA-methyltransferase (adenine-specific)